MKVVCNIPWTLTQSGGEPHTYVGDPAAAIRDLQKYQPDVEVLCCAAWDAVANKTTLIIRKRK